MSSHMLIFTLLVLFQVASSYSLHESYSLKNEEAIPKKVSSSLESYLADLLRSSDSSMRQFLLKQRQQAELFAATHKAAVREDLEKFIRASLSGGQQEEALRAVKHDKIVPEKEILDVDSSAFVETRTILGTSAGINKQGKNCVAIGFFAGTNFQASKSTDATAVGHNAGAYFQDGFTTAVGSNAGYDTQAYGGVAIGVQAGNSYQGVSGVAVGNGAGYSKQGNKGIAIGYHAGYTNQGNYAIAIGNNAGMTNQHNNTIIISASSFTTVNSINPASFYVRPIRGVSASLVNDRSSNALRYNPFTSEIFYVIPLPLRPTNKPTSRPSRPSASPSRKPATNRPI